VADKGNLLISRARVETFGGSEMRDVPPHPNGLSDDLVRAALSVI
jgi:hypothetical protein